MGKSKDDNTAAKDMVDSWHERDQRITVKEVPGFLYTIQLQAKVQSAPAEIYDILTDPNTVSIFRNIKECTYRKVLEDDGKGRRKLEIGHRAIAKFLFINITFDTQLYVWEDDRERSIRFQTAREGMMKKFDGCWHIQPFTQSSLDRWNHPERMQQPSTMQSLFNGLSLWHVPTPKESLVTLEQSILPRGPAPPGIKGLIRTMCAHQIKNMMEDLNKELDRRRNGTSKVLKEREDRKLQQAVAAKAASMSMAQACLWDAAAPIQLVIKL